MNWNRKQTRTWLLRSGGIAGITAAFVLQVNCCHAEKVDGIIRAVDELSTVIAGPFGEHDHETGHHTESDQHNHKSHDDCGEHDCPAAAPDSLLSELRRVSLELDPRTTLGAVDPAYDRAHDFDLRVSMRLRSAPPRGSPITRPPIHLMNQTFLN